MVCIILAQLGTDTAGVKRVMDTSYSNPMAQTDAVEQRFAPAPSCSCKLCHASSRVLLLAPDAASANVFNVEGTDIIEGGSIAGLDFLRHYDVIDPELGINIIDLGLVYGVKVAADTQLSLT